MSIKKTHFIFFVFVTNFCFAQATISRTANATVNLYSYSSLDVTTNGFLDFKFNTNQELLDGIALTNKFNASIVSNKNWILNVSTLTSSFLAIGPDASNQMPPSVLSIKKSTSATYVPLTNNPSMITTGFRGGQTAANTFKLDIKATPGYTFNGGAYAIVLLFTLSAQ